MKVLEGGREGGGRKGREGGRETGKQGDRKERERERSLVTIKEMYWELRRREGGRGRERERDREQREQRELYCSIPGIKKQIKYRRPLSLTLSVYSLSERI